MVFANIEYLFLLLLLIPYIVWYIMKRRNNEADTSDFGCSCICSYAEEL